MQVRVLHDLSLRCRNSARYNFLENLLKLSKRKYISIDYFSRMQNFCILFNAFKRPKIRENLQKLYCIGSVKFSWNAEIIHLLQLLKWTKNLLNEAKMQKYCILFSGYNKPNFTAFIQDAEILQVVKLEENC